MKMINVLHHIEFKRHPKRLSNMHHFFSCDYNWEGIELKDWKKFEKK